jgi:low temperature requirement protein LtrA
MNSCPGNWARGSEGQGRAPRALMRLYLRAGGAPGTIRAMTDTPSRNPAQRHPPLRHRDGRHANVTNEELFFDLAYVFAVTQLSHLLLHRLDLGGAVDTLILWGAVWLGWQYTCWVTNWFDPESPRIRLLLFATMLIALVMASAIPQAFGARGLVFACAYAAMQVGRSLWVVWQLRGGHPLLANYRRILGWGVIVACFWIAGGLNQGDARRWLWGLGVLCEYVSPMLGFWLPGLGASRTSDWTIEGGHLAERCQSFVIVALGEALTATGAGFSDAQAWSGPMVAGMVLTFGATLAMWWLYFGTSCRDATARITHADDPGAMGARFHYIHALLAAGIIVAAVANDLIIEAPMEEAHLADMMVLVAGPGLYLLASAVYKGLVYGRVPLSHLVGLGVFGRAGVALAGSARLVAGGVLMVLLLGVALWEHCARRGQKV